MKAASKKAASKKAASKKAASKKAASKKAASKKAGRTRGRPRNSNSGERTSSQKAGFSSPFEVRAADIANLNEEHFKEFVKALIRCERNEASFAGGDTIFGDEMKAADEGADAITSYFRTSVAPDAQRVARLIPDGETVWQLKAEKRGPSAAQLKKELGKPAVKAVLRNGGNYVLVAQQPADATSQVRNGKELRRISKSKRAFFVGQSQLELCGRRYPSLARQVSVFTGAADAFGGLKAGTEWSREFEHATAFQPSNGRTEQIGQIVDWLKSPNRVPAGNIRVLGPPGIGKTRLVLEALRAADYLQASVYATGRNSVPPTFLTRASSTDWECVLVVDECRNSDWRELIGAFGQIFNRIRLITIGHTGDETAGSYGPTTKVIIVEHLSAEAIERILASKSPLITPDRAAWVAQKTGGYVKLALLLADAIADTSDEKLEQLDKKRVICDYLRTILGTEKSLNLFKMMALFTRIGFSGKASSQFEYLARHLGIAHVDADSVRGEAERRGIVSRAEPYCYVTPELLQDWLVTELLHDSFSATSSLFQGAPQDLLSLAAPRLSRFVDEGIPGARELVESLIRTNPAFAEVHSLANEQVAHALVRLARASRSETTALLNRWLRSADLNEVSSTVRSELVYLLLEAMWHIDTFSFAFERMLHLASMESDPGLANNATGSILSVFLVHLAPTLAPYSARLEVAQRLIKSAPAAVRLLLVEAVGKGLEVQETGIVSPPGRSLRDNWNPSSNEETLAAKRGALDFVIAALADIDTSIQSKAASEIVQSFRSLLWAGLSADALRALRAVGLESYSVRESLEHAIAFDKDRITEKSMNEIRQFYMELPVDLLSDVRFATSGWDIVEEERSTLGLRQSPNLPELASRVLLSDQHQQVVSILVSEQARNSGPLAYELGRTDGNRILWACIVAQKDGARAVWVASIYLAGFLDALPEEQSIIAALLSSENRRLKEIGSRAVASITPNVSVLADVIERIGRHEIDPSWLSGIQLGRWTSRVDAGLLSGLLRALLAHSELGVEVALDAAQMAIHGGTAIDKEVLCEIAVMALRLRRQDSYRWAKVAKAALPEHAFAIGRALLSTPGSFAGTQSADEASAVFEKCVDVSGKSLALEGLEQAVLGNRYNARVVKLLSRRMIDAVGIENLLKWADGHGDLAQTVLAELAPKTPTPVVLVMFEHFGISGAFASGFGARFMSGGHWGPSSGYYADKANQLEKWANNVELPGKFRAWAAAFAIHVRRRASEALADERQESELEKLDER
jgi:hypothetical protein